MNALQRFDNNAGGIITAMAINENATHRAFRFSSNKASRCKELLDLVGRHNLATFVEATMRAGMMRAHHFTAIWAFTHSWNANRIVGAAHLALGRAGFSLWNCHIHLLCSQPNLYNGCWAIARRRNRPSLPVKA